MATETPAGRVTRVCSILERIYPDTKPLLAYRNCFELLVAVILSAQCTDDRVNLVTPVLFARWPDAPSLAAAPLSDLEAVVKSTGFYHAKARYLSESARLVVERFGGAVPPSIDELLLLPGVGRKTANLVASACFDAPGLIVDTHVSRVCLRLGMSKDRDPLRIERILADALPPARWTAASHALNRLGKLVCDARKPACPSCPVAADCPSRGTAPRSRATTRKKAAP